MNNLVSHRQFDWKEHAMHGHLTQMLEAHSAGRPSEVLVRCIGTCVACAQACTACADACLAEQAAHDLARCIRVNLDCADVCAATGRVLTRQTAFEARLARPVLEACAELCRLCAEECERHAAEMSMEHCRLCAEACRRCERACEELLGSLDA